MMKDDPIYVTQPYLPPLAEFIPYLEEIWRTKTLTNMGDFHKSLEQELCNYLGVKHISLFSNGTLALVTALQAIRITGEVITTPFSFVATTHAIWWNGIRPVFVDIEPRFMNLDPSKIEAAITPQTTAILAVHVYGNPCQLDEMKRIADIYGLKLIYDACHAFGVKVGGSSVLNFGDLSVLSFHATKVFNTFEGGAIVCHDEQTKRRIDFLKNFGFADEVTVVAPGVNAKMNEVQAAFGLLQLKHISPVLERRRTLVRRYREGLSGVKGIEFLHDMDDVNHNYAYFPVLVDTKEYGRTRDELYDHLKNNNVFARRYFYPLISQFPAYRGLPSARAENLPVAERVSRQVLCLPLYPALQESQQDLIASLVRG
jgi:dTDP-4-amino-4,6-dideoxygalactose transaminase